MSWGGTYRTRESRPGEPLTGSKAERNLEDQREPSWRARTGSKAAAPEQRPETEEWLWGEKVIETEKSEC